LTYVKEVPMGLIYTASQFQPYPQRREAMAAFPRGTVWVTSRMSAPSTTGFKIRLADTKMLIVIYDSQPE
jgi:hypothetical protein